ncbi:neuropeptide-like 4 [Penaeus chinensis]|uniref:neuropeptide-like 4 n=1 Tax=Penaeus chinensis TaxID=139456 RepID=UPI001FB81163|nr:neuropeptide-like 4 [Penaeus chinensis]
MKLSLVLVALALLWCSAEAIPGPSALPQPTAGAVANPEAAPDAAADPEAYRRRYGRGRYGYYRPSHSVHYYHDHHHHLVCDHDHCHDIVHYH